MTYSGHPEPPTPQISFRLFLATLAMLGLFAFVAYRGAETPQSVHVVPGQLLISPYLQLGETGKLSDMELVWGSADVGSKWEVSTSVLPSIWIPCPAPTSEPITIAGLPHFRMYHARLGTIADTKVRYRLSRDGQLIGGSDIRTMHSASQPYRFAVLGDIANGSRGQRQIANALLKAQPEVVFVAGDIVYHHGRLLEYFNHFFPIYNADTPSVNGVPLLRSTLFVAAPGNHDTAVGSGFDTRNLTQFPDGLAYYLVWKQPLNGPDLKEGGPNTPIMRATIYERRAFLNGAGRSYPRMSNFSFDYANAHWTILDANAYVNWLDPALRQWVAQDISNAKLAKWHFVLFHQAPFNSDAHHNTEQRMRLMADVFQSAGVDIVFAGHVHNYQRSRPLFFSMRKNAKGQFLQDNGTVNGDARLDMDFDGVNKTHAHGVIYIITGCGGAQLTGVRNAGDKSHWQPFTAQFVSRHSFTQCDMDGNRMLVQQIDADGNVLDKFELTK